MKYTDWTEVGLTGPIRPIWTELDQIIPNGPNRLNWTTLD